MENILEGGNSTPMVDSPNDNFFDQLEEEVNGQVSEPALKKFNPSNTTESTQDSGSNEATHSQETANVGAIDWDSDTNPYKKRYGDSSREAQKMKSELDGLKPFIPVLDVMKQDSGLVDHVRQYLLSGGAPTETVQAEVGVGPDFQYNEQEALTNPESDSAKVLNAHVDSLVKSRVGKMIDAEKSKSEQIQQKVEKSKQEREFKAKYNMTDDEFNGMVTSAKDHKLTLEDVYFLVNKDKTAANVADSTKKDMLQQMKNVRSIPASNSNVNSAGKATKSNDDQLFDSILGSDGDLESLFG